MANEAEVAFVKKLAGVLAEQPVNYNDDFQPPLDQYMKKVPALQVRRPDLLIPDAMVLCNIIQVVVPPPPVRTGTESGPTGAPVLLHDSPPRQNVNYRVPRCHQHHDQVSQASTDVHSERTPRR